jgi:hypothetical protein
VGGVLSPLALLASGIAAPRARRASRCVASYGQTVTRRDHKRLER